MPDTQTANAQKRTRFGTFGGVFTPSILTILGLILFMRSNFVVGQSGIWNALLILMMAKSITSITTLSLSAVSSNMRVGGGGAYFLISRVLGPEFGGAIGATLYIALAVSVPFYILGFTEALTATFPGLQPWFQWITLTAAGLLFVVAFIGAKWAIKTQYAIMAILGLAIVTFLSGAALDFSWSQFLENAKPLSTEVFDQLSASSPEAFAGISVFGFWAMFALYFPAVTGIDAGLNMSGDLEDAAKSIPRGTLAAVGVGLLVYALAIVICGGAFSRSDLLTNPFGSLTEGAIFGAGFLVVGGAFAATLSSALGSYLGAPRVLQAFARDPILRILRPFGKGEGPGDEPRRALWLTGIVTFAVLIWAGEGTGGQALNLVASMIAMFFLYSYGTINFAAFFEAFSGNPSFRPTFKWFHWVFALLGSVGCIAAAFLIDVVSAAAALVVLLAFFWIVRVRKLQANFGDARRGFVYNSMRRNLLQLAQMREDSRNWRPTILALTGNPRQREVVLRYATWMEARSGLVLVGVIMTGDLDEQTKLRARMLKNIRQFFRDQKLEAFPMVMMSKDREEGFRALLQTGSMGPVPCNVVVQGWSDDPERVHAFAEHCRSEVALEMSTVVICNPTVPTLRPGKRIDVWWRGQQNGSLMLMLAYLISTNWEWTETDIRVIRTVEREEGVEGATKALEELIEQSRVPARAEVFAETGPYKETLHRHSADASCIFLGFQIPDSDPLSESNWHNRYHELIKELPTVVLVHAVTDADVIN